MRARLDAELSERVRVTLAVDGREVWSWSGPVEAWHRQVVRLIVQNTISRKARDVAGALARGLLP